MAPGSGKIVYKSGSKSRQRKHLPDIQENCLQMEQGKKKRNRVQGKPTCKEEKLQKEAEGDP